MDDSLLRIIEFDKYFRSTKNALPDTRATGLYSKDGLRAHDGDIDELAILEEAIEFLNDTRPGWQEQSESVRSVVAHNGSQIIYAQMAAADGVLIVVRSGADGEAAEALMEPVVQCLRQEFQLTMELESMTAELTERYEELNLVYHTEDQVHVFREGRDALGSLVENCCDYLGVGLTLLSLRPKKIEIIECSDTGSISDPRRIATGLQTDLYSWIEAHNESIVINDVADPRSTTMLRGLPYKVLATPILGGSGAVAGMLAIVNDYSKADFSNSDRNLLSVMARKAGKIVQTNYDALTGLVNRGGFEYFLEAALDGVRGTSREHCILHINVDQLRVVNDTASHHAGDEVLRQVVNRTAAHLRETDTCARIGGDQFGALLENCSVDHGFKIAEQIRASVADTAIQFDSRAHKTSVSIGLSILSADTPELTSALAGAELACGEAGDKGGNRIEIYHDQNSEVMQRHRQMQLVERIQRAIANDGFTLFVQPIVPIQDPRAHHHYEILLRMIDSGDIVSPALFVPAAERYHMMPAIDRWVVTQTLKRLAELPADVVERSVFSINLSGQSIGEAGFLKFLEDSLADSPIPNEAICFEITETAAIGNLRSATHFITVISSMGCQFALDDFGVGLSSFSYLKSLPVDQLKIDGEFVKDLLADEVSAAMVAAINQVGHTLGLTTVAEFVENAGIKDRLTEMGVDYVQGFGVCKPMPLDEMLAELQSQPAAVAS